MKKICFIAFSLFVAIANLAAASVDLYGALSVKTDLDKESVGLDSSVCGIKVTIPFFDGRFYWNGEDISYGVAFNSEKLNKTFPVQAKWGRLSIGGGLSKLNNPLISSSVSPFSSAVSSINPVTANLSSSFNKTDTFFFQVGYKNQGTKKKVLQEKSDEKVFTGKSVLRGILGNGDFSLQNATLNCFYDPNGDLFSPFGNVALSSLVAFNLPKKLKLSAECTFESFVYKGLEASSWYTDSPFYHDGRGNSVLSQIHFSGNNFSSIFSGGFYVSPFGELKTIWKNESKIKISNSTLGLSILYNPSHNLMTPSGKTIDECLQGKVSFQYQFRSGKRIPLFWKPGISGFYQRNLTEESDDLKLSCGLQFFCVLTSASIVLQSDFKIFSGEFAKSTLEQESSKSCDMISDAGKSVLFSKGTVTLKNQWYFPAIQPGLKLSASFSPSSDYLSCKISENCALNLSFCENPSVSMQCGATFKQKIEQANVDSTGIDFDLSGTVKLNLKKVKCTGKISVKIDF